jgi:hypothetical protein
MRGPIRTLYSRGTDSDSMGIGWGPRPLALGLGWGYGATGICEAGPIPSSGLYKIAHSESLWITCG